MIRVRVETTSTALRVGIEALLRGEVGIEVVGPAMPADVLVREDIPELSDTGSDLPIVLLTDDLSPQEALGAGVRAVLPRSATSTQIAGAIQAASAGLIVIPAESFVVFAPMPAEPASEPLTPREMDVIEMLAEGLSNKLIADRLGISEHTAKFHVNSILAKLHAGTRTEAVMRGLRLGLIKI